MHQPDNQQPTYEDLELLVRLSELLVVHDLEAVLQQVIELVARWAQADKASLFLVDGTDVDWTHLFTARALENEELVRVVRSVLDDGLAGSVVRSKQSAIVYDTETDDRWHVFPDDTLVARSAMCVPFINEDEVVAVLTLIHSEPNHFSKYQLRFMSIVTNQATVAIQNAQLIDRLQSQQRQLEAVLQSVPDTLFVLDESTRVVLVNKGAMTFLKAGDQQQVLGKAIADFYEHSNLFVEIKAALDNQLQEVQEVVLEGRSEAHDRDFIVMLSTWEDPGGVRGGFVVVMHDVTTQRNMDRFRDEMMHIVSHDLRSPLSLIAGYADMLDLDLEPDSPMRSYTDVIHRSVRRMNSLLDEMLQPPEIDQNRLNAADGVSLAAIVREVWNNVGPLAERRRQTLVDEIRIDDNVRRKADPVLLRQAMENYANNATKYTPEEGTITLRAYTRGRNFYFEVEDNGIGVPSDSLPHVFAPYFRAKHRIVEEVAGSGIGLSLVKSIVERHDGEVWVESEEGVGSLFGMRLPL